MIGERINVEHVRPPVPSIAFDYRATFDSYDGAPDTPASARPMGYGPTAYDAILDLLFQADDPDLAEDRQ